MSIPRFRNTIITDTKNDVKMLIASPRLILADEPTGNLHSDQGREIMELFTKLNEDGTTIVQVTHSETNAARPAPRLMRPNNSPRQSRRESYA